MSKVLTKVVVWAALRLIAIVQISSSTAEVKWCKIYRKTKFLLREATSKDCNRQFQQIYKYNGANPLLKNQAVAHVGRVQMTALF
jgi:hypothetical protein